MENGMYVYSAHATRDVFRMLSNIKYGVFSENS